METANDLMDIPEVDSGELATLVIGIGTPEFASIILFQQDTAYQMAVECIRYAYTLGYKRGKESTIEFVVADEEEVPNAANR